LRFNPGVTKQEVEFPLLQLRHGVEDVLALQPKTEVQKRILGEIGEEWPNLWERLVFPDDELRLEALDILLRLVKGIRGRLAEGTRNLVALIEMAMQNIKEEQGQVIVAYLGQML
ncbi:MAG TPA: hypothetical protein DDW87_03655, partial [Firmicutes bacterium]|nr:hypothetical protein [Bacillota bacterium]